MVEKLRYQMVGHRGRAQMAESYQFVQAQHLAKDLMEGLLRFVKVIPRGKARTGGLWLFHQAVPVAKEVMDELWRSRRGIHHAKGLMVVFLLFRLEELQQCS